MNADFTSEEKFLIKKDKVLSNVIKTNGPIKFSNNRKDPFDTFVDIIISQFISTLAAKSIKEKMLENFNEKNFKDLARCEPHSKIGYSMQIFIRSLGINNYPEVLFALVLLEFGIFKPQKAR